MITRRLHFLLFFLGLVLFLYFGRYSLKATGGFSLSKVQNNFYAASTAHHSLTPEIKAILKQEFHYYKRGAQVFVFISKDKNYVLKLLNNRLLKKQRFLSVYPFQHSKHASIDRRLEVTYSSYDAAATTLKEETGIVYANLVPETTSKRRITLIDHLGIKHKIKLRDSAFILQRKTKLIYPTLKKMIKNDQQTEAQEVIKSLIHLVSQCHSKGYLNEDPSIRKNFGVQGSQCQVLDVGRFVYHPKLKNGSSYQIKRHFHGFRKWLKKQCPDLVSYFDQEAGL